MIDFVQIQIHMKEVRYRAKARNAKLYYPILPKSALKTDEGLEALRWRTRATVPKETRMQKNPKERPRKSIVSSAENQSIPCIHALLQWGPSSSQAVWNMRIARSPAL